jgi:signal transduction histidine kinase
MPLRTFVPLVAALLCLEVTIAFAVLYVKVSRRKADLLFSVVSLCLAWMTWASFKYNGTSAPSDCLFWLRMQYVGAGAAVTVFVHFVSVVVNQPMRPVGVVLTYFIGSVLIVFTGSDLFLRLPSGRYDLHHFVTECQGPLFPLFAPLLIMGAFVAWLKLMHSSHQQRETGFAPLATHVRFIFLSGVLIIIAGAAVVIVVTFFRDFSIPVSPHSLAVVIFCVFTAIALGKETLRSEAEKKRLAELVQFRNQAVRDVAHELRNPLAAIQGAMQTILRGLERGIEPTKQRELLDMGVDACKRLTRLLNNMLDTARLEAGRQLELRLERTNVPALVESVLEWHRKDSAPHRLQFQCELAATVVTLDADKLHQILFNLVNNALKYSPQGGDVTVRAWEQNDTLHFSVRDQGIGMTPEQISRLFQPFERVVNPDRKITGTGIGLHLVKQLVEAHGGRIWVESAPGKGSVFTFTLRAQKNESPSPSP